MHPFSDSDTSDSEDGIRFKTQSTRKKEKSVKEQRHRSAEHRKENRRRRSRSRSRHRHRSRSRSRDRHRHKKHRREKDNPERQSSSRSTDSARPVKSSKQVPESSNDRVKNVSSDVSRKKDEQEEGIVKGVKRDEEEDDDDAFGPSLPPTSSDADGGKISQVKKKCDATGIGPALSTILSVDTTPKLNNAIGQALLSKLSSDDVSKTSPEEVETIGPVSPARLNSDVATTTTVDDDTADIIGPALSVSLDDEHIISTALRTKFINPEAPGELKSSAKSESMLSSNVSRDEHINEADIDPILPSSIVQNDTFLGTALPSNLLQSNTSIGPVLPTHILSIGPDMPSNSVKDNSSSDKDDNSPPHDNEVLDANFGPSLPPSFSKTREPKCIGPTLPAHLRERLKNNEEISEFGEEEGDDDNDYGPLPVDAKPRTAAQVALEERALQMKLDKLNPAEDGKPRREDWMIELPSAAARIGLGARQFRAKEGPDMSDRSSWTDTPLDKEKKTEKPVDLKEEAELQESEKRDKEQEAIIKNHKKKKKRDKSLLEQHQEKIKKKKDEESGSGNVRRPFSRDIDLKVNHFDEAQKKAIFKKAQMLDDRFSKGQTKYL